MSLEQFASSLTCSVYECLRHLVAHAAKSGKFILSLLPMFLLFACDGNYLVWSTDGKMGAAIGAKGLRICDGEGNISPVLYENAGMFRWLPQEHQGFVVGYEYVGTWAELKGILTPVQEKQVLAESAQLRKKILNYKGNQEKFPENSFRNFVYPLEAVVHLRFTADFELRKMAVRKWPAFQSVKVPVFFIKQIQIDDRAIKVVRVVDKGVDEIVELRPSPGTKHIACVKHENGRERNYIQVIPVRAFAKPVFVAADTNVSPDWTVDGKQLLYSRASAVGEIDLLKGQEIHEGGLFKVDLQEAANHSVEVTKKQKVCKLIFDSRAPVRVLKDGRVLFLSRELRLPAAVGTNLSTKLFLLDGMNVEIIFSKNEDVAYFEPSPDHEQVAVTLSNGALFVAKITPGVGEIHELCNGKESRVSGILPQWKNNNELSYGAEQPVAKGAKPNYGIMLWSKGAAVKDLSKSWGKDAASEIIVHRDIFQEAMKGVLSDMDRSPSMKNNAQVKSK